MVIAKPLYLVGVENVHFYFQTRNQPVLVGYIGKCMVSRIIINYGIKKPICGHQNSNTGQIFIFGGNVEVREPLCTRVII